MIPIHIVGGRGFVYDVADVKRLREEFHVCGVLSGVLPQFPQQNIFGGLPLQLLPEDVKFLLELGEAFLVDDAALHAGGVAEPSVVHGALAVVPAASRPRAPLTPARVEYVRPRPERYQIYKYLMQRQYFVMPGLRFGCQFMAYPGDLMRYHSHYNVLGYGWDEPFPILDIVGGGRLATSVKKCWVVGAAEPNTGETHAFSIEWAGFG